MANAEQLAHLVTSGAERNGCRAWNQWRSHDWQREIRQYRTPIDLSGADLSGIDMYDADLRAANLHAAHLSHANLNGVDFRNADLTGADLSEANLNYARFRNANLDNADIRNALLMCADLRGAHVGCADLRNARLEQPYLTGVDLRRCQLAGAYVAEFDGKPLWPHVDAITFAALRATAANPLTTPQWLMEAACHWPGYVVRGLIARNPNTPSSTFIALAAFFPEAFLTNPAVPLLFLEDPEWPGHHSISAFNLLKAIQRKPSLREEHHLLVAFIEHSYQRWRHG